MSMWDEIEALVTSGKHPQVLLPKAARVIDPKGPRGRPRRCLYPRPPDMKNWRYTSWIMRCPSGRAMRCRRFGCNRNIRSDRADIVCSEDCRKFLRDWCETHLAVLNGTMRAEDFPYHYRDTRVLRNLSDESRKRGKMGHGQTRH